MPYQRSLRLDNILVIDDDSQILDTIRCFLQHVGYEVATAGSGEEGIRLLDSGYEYDLVMTDIRMPGMNGNELAKIIRNSDLSHMPIIAMTGYHDDVDQELFDSILEKPFALKILSEIIQTLIRKEEGSQVHSEAKNEDVKLAFAEH